LDSEELPPSSDECVGMEKELIGTTLGGLEVKFSGNTLLEV